MGEGGRVWTYSRESWDPKHRWIPVRGSDEYGRLTIVLPIPFTRGRARMSRRSPERKAS